jgi:hypothetical protein
MTHATPERSRRHDTLSVVTAKSGRGTARQTIRVDEDLWELFDAARVSAGEDSRSVVVRDFIRWYVREKGARLPKRPDAE